MTGTGEHTQFGEIFKLMKAEEVSIWTVNLFNLYAESIVWIAFSRRRMKYPISLSWCKKKLSTLYIQRFPCITLLIQPIENFNISWVWKQIQSNRLNLDWEILFQCTIDWNMSVDSNDWKIENFFNPCEDLIFYQPIRIRKLRACSKLCYRNKG